MAFIEITMMSFLTVMKLNAGLESLWTLLTIN